MIFYDAFSMGPLITKSSKFGKRVQFSLSLHTKRNARQQTPPPPSNNGSRRHRHRASEGVRARLRATGEKMHETRPTRVYAHREQDGVRCVLSINIIIIIIIALFFFPCLSIFWGKSNTYIYIATLSRFGSHQKTFSLHLLQNATTGFIMFGFVGFFVKLVL